jgi:transposase-like protein
MGLNLSNEQIGQELDLAAKDVQIMTSQLRAGIIAKKPVQLSGEVEKRTKFTLPLVIKGIQPLWQAKIAKAERRKLKGKCGRGTLAEEKPPVLGMIQRNGKVAIQMLPNVQQVTIQPFMTKTIQAGSLIYTDEYNIYDRLEQWGYQHKSVNHSAGEYWRRFS